MSPILKSIVVPLSEVPLEDPAPAPVLRNAEPAKPVVLVVDDERMVADTLTIIFKRAGLNALTAYSAKGALDIASVMAPDILVSDVDMPVMNGVDLAVTLLRLVPECKVLLFSGHASFADLAAARASGYDFPLLPKPVHPSVMLESVSKYLEGDITDAARSQLPTGMGMRLFEAGA